MTNRKKGFVVRVRLVPTKAKSPFVVRPCPARRDAKHGSDTGPEPKLKPRLQSSASRSASSSSGAAAAPPKQARQASVRRDRRGDAEAGATSKPRPAEIEGDRCSHCGQAVPGGAQIGTAAPAAHEAGKDPKSHGSSETRRRREPNSGSWPPGHCPNPKGRPKGSLNLIDQVDKEITKKRFRTAEGKKMSGVEAAAQVVIKKAVKDGDFSSAKELLSQAHKIAAYRDKSANEQKVAQSANHQDTMVSIPAGRAILERYVRRYAERFLASSLEEGRSDDQ